MFRIEPVFEDVHWLPGVMPKNVQREPDIANAFIIERCGAAYLIDTGIGPEFRRALSDFFAWRQYDSVTLINTHAHPDHIGNNDLIHEIPAGEKKHLIHKAGVANLDPYEWLKGELRLASRSFSLFAFDAFPLSLAGAFLRLWERVSPESAYRFFARMSLGKFEPIRGRTPFVVPLSPVDRVPVRIGGLQFRGWRAGELVLLEDGGHSPDSIVVFDPLSRVLIVGDLLYEYNPLWPSGTYKRMIERMIAYRTLAAAGEVSTLADGHHHVLFRGAGEIVCILDELIACHEQRMSAIEKAARETRSRSVEDVRHALVARDAEFARLVSGYEFPRAICLTRSMIAVALREMDEGEH